MQEESSKFEIVRTDPDTGMISREVIPFPSDRFLELVPALIDRDSDAITGHFVDNDVPLGARGKGKLFRYRTSTNQYDTAVINYEITNGAIRFIDFSPIMVDGYTVDVRHGEDSDLLEVDLGKQKFAPTDSKEVNRIRWVLRTLQQFNNELMNEAMDDDSDVMEDNEDSYDDNDSVTSNNYDYNDGADKEDDESETD